MPTSSRQKKKKGGDVAVQGTNDSSVVSKASAAARGYFHDHFLQHFVCKEARRAPLINRGYYVRWRAVDHCVRRFLHVTENCPKRQILSLGAGFDSLYFRLRADEALAGVVVFEVDFPDVAGRKTALISSNITLRGMLDPHLPAPTGAVHVCSGQYRLLGLDVREESQVKEALEAAGLDWAAPTLILSEVVLTYMETQWSDVVISWAAKLLPQSLFVMYEQIHPHDPFGSIMQDHFHKLNSTLHALRQYPDTAAQRRRFLDKGWDQCVCLDMNDFYLGLVPEDERRRVEDLEPFDEYEEWHQKCSHYFILTASQGSCMTQALLTHPPVSPVSSVNPSLSPVALSVKLDPACVEGLGMASSSVSPGWLLLTGGSGRGGRGAVSRVLLRGQEGWRSVTVEPSLDLGVRLYHTVTSCPGGGAVVYGGRSSPLSPARGLFKVLLDPAGPPAPLDGVKLCVEEMLCTGDPPPPRWRHTAAIVSHKGKDFLFVYGGKNESDAVLGDGHFLCLDQLLWTEIPVEGAAPEPLHSHSACSYQGGVVMFGGLDRRGVPLGDTVVLRPTDRGFSWETIELQPPPVPRYSHSAHVIGQKLVVVGGVWMHSDGVPGVVMIDLATRSSVEFSLDTTRVPWPLMLHSFCCELTDSEEPELLLIGGGGSCFSFGTHFNPQPVTLNLRPVLG
ncbi:tRNA wybutosine-synthesizing protein 4 [Hippoglossus stenolepis]|uniref:tRNA wybutosine-synthesizing protein 4 n=1 Tax=Hippoglossus stenolepis TaxID=195615 RepID=UPI001FAFA8FB|nr:tRNA wybutosine-synthesizing protein 4 [Hippoglossus stenolepis]XP_035030290.2 tRNA wybutosine-synthesizing protein 4 [Hippoglossus stenolepis]XP_035030291.2 tRNA wybutosine-synthesizing protein 4 [Hippoglossus stenolepis]